MSSPTRFLSFIVIILITICFSQRSCYQRIIGNFTNQRDTTVIIDTVLDIHDSVIIRKVPVIKRDTSYLPTDTQYLPSPDYIVLKSRFEALVKEHTARNIYSDSLKLDSIGYVVVSDSVQFNKLFDRSYKYHYEIPNITKTITIVEHPKKTNQVYLGGGILGNKIEGVSGAELGLLLKNKKDQIYGVKISSDIKGNVLYGVQSYWKIKLKK
jgi:hypothetical protein